MINKTASMHFNIEFTCSFNQNEVAALIIYQKAQIAMNDMVTLENTTKTDRGNLASSAEDRSAQTLRAIELLEEHLRKMRDRIEELRTRRQQLVREIEQVDAALEAEDARFTQKANAVLGAFASIDEPASDRPASTEPPDLETFLAGTNNSPDEKPGSKRFEGWLESKEKEHRERTSGAKRKR